jgi:hypothetical protein
MHLLVHYESKYSLMFGCGTYKYIEFPHFCLTFEYQTFTEFVNIYICKYFNTLYYKKENVIKTHMFYIILDEKGISFFYEIPHV